MSLIKKTQAEFPVGCHVEWAAVYERRKTRRTGFTEYTHGVRPRMTYEPASGVVVGCRWKRAGKKWWGSSDGDEPSYFEVQPNGSLLVLLVKPGYSNKEIEVPLDSAFRFSIVPRVPFDLPSTWAGSSTLPEYRVRLSKEMKEIYANRSPTEFPRDSKGRFKKYSR